MATKRFVRNEKQCIIYTDGKICESTREVLHSDLFEKMVGLFVKEQLHKGSPLLAALNLDLSTERGPRLLINILCTLCEHPLDQVISILPGANIFIQEKQRAALHEFVERLYDYWRSHDRYLVLLAKAGPTCLDQRPHRAFNETLVALGHHIRSLYRNVCENITGTHPRIYRHVAAGCTVGLNAVPGCGNLLPALYEKLVGNVPLIRQVWITPPLILDPPINECTGRFQKIETNPLHKLSIRQDEWLCYPAQVGPLIIFIYFHQRFIGLGASLANLFELASDEQIVDRPDAIYLFGAPAEHMQQFGDIPTVFFDDKESHLLVAAIPLEDRFCYFGYLQKMILTLHNIIMMKRGCMPFHGALARIILKSGRASNVLLIGDTATGKSETLEAFRILGSRLNHEMRIIADDMGSLEINARGRVIAYGTEVGAFIRLDKLQQGYAFDQINRAIIMSPQKLNARVVLPVTTIEEVLKGHAIDLLLYANNYEEVDDEHPVVELFTDTEQALKVFREGTVMARDTTTSIGLAHSYFANIFGPPHYKELHEQLAGKVFAQALQTGTRIGQLRTRIGIPGYETSGPETAARALLDLIATDAITLLLNHYVNSFHSTTKKKEQQTCHEKWSPSTVTRPAPM